METKPQEPTPKDFSDKFAKSLTMFFRWFADTFLPNVMGTVQSFWKQWQVCRAWSRACGFT